MHLTDKLGLVFVTTIIAVTLVRFHSLYKNGRLTGP